MSPRYDLHSHTSVSDGTLSPAALVQRARAHHVDVLAVTDHDSTAGVDGARRAGVECGVRIIPGVEISVTWAGQLIHMVGLGVETESPRLQEGLARLRKLRHERATVIAARLERIGIPGALVGSAAETGGEVIGRSHFARFLGAAGHCRDVQTAFRRYLRCGRPAYVACEWASLEEAVEWVNLAGGKAVIAHPARYRMSSRRMRALLEEFKALGGLGIEVVSSSHSPADIDSMAGHARAFGLYASVGSDFHTPGHPWAELGALASLPAGCQPIWRSWEGGDVLAPEDEAKNDRRRAPVVLGDTVA